MAFSMSNPIDREVAVFSAARQLPAGERAAYLDEACAGDAALRQRVEELLRATEEAGAFLQDAAPGAQRRANALAPPNPPQHVAAPGQKVGDHIGRYKLLQQIGEGGCGAVYMAEQEEPVRRRVALKVIKLGMDTKQVIARFEAERQALALMDHPNIAKVLEAGATDTGRPYFVMELVRGIKITDYCDENHLSTEARLDLFMKVAQAVQHAHQKGIIHRDLKPSNVLVADHDGLPVPKIIDFGIAKATTDQRLTDKTLFTAFEQFIGTPAYMSPEQARMSGLDIDTRTDIYSLGVLLYELLTGKTPFDAQDLLAAGLDEMRRTIGEQEPARPSTRLSTMLEGELTTTAKHRHTDAPKLVHLIRGDLDWIVMKALEKDRARRYETANGLAMDIERHLKNEPVVARPPSRLYEFQKTVQRHKFGFAAAGAVGVALLLGLAVSISLLVQEKAARQRASAAEREQERLRELAQAKERTAQANERKAQTEARKSRQVAQFLKDMLRSVSPEVSLGRDTAMLREILDQTAQRVGKELRDDPEVEAELRSVLGTTFWELGDLHRSEEMHREALRLNRSRFDDTNRVVADSLKDLGRALCDQSKFAEGEILLRRALAINKILMGEEDPYLIWPLYDLADGLAAQGKLGEAEATYREAIKILRKRPGNNGPDLITLLGGLVRDLRSQRKLEEAESLGREALELSRRCPGPGDLNLATALLRLAMVLHEEQKFPEAERLAREGLAIRRKIMGNDHPWVSSALGALAPVLEGAGKLAEAEAVYRERLTYDEHREQALQSRGDLGRCLLKQKKYAEAEQLFLSSYQGLSERQDRISADEKAALNGTVYNLVQLYEETQRPDQATEWEKKLGEFDHALVAQSIPARERAASTNLIDLGSVYNATLTASWHESGSASNDLSELPRGIQMFAGVQFDVRGLIQLSASFNGHNRYPNEVRDILVHRTCQKLHFLHAAIYGGGAPDGTKIGRYIIHYASGTQSELPIVMGQSLGDWWTQLDEQDKRFTIAWVGENAECRRQGNTIRLFKSTWGNPAPDDTVTTIDFIGDQKGPAPFLVAITVEP
ncbi:MAG: tetratricopeptide repeat protein [Verrucomicrobia bacterium]|nr:tetratricopeptide repeat protein [Verrucomicrobiota bacterium]